MRNLALAAALITTLVARDASAQEVQRLRLVLESDAVDAGGSVLGRLYVLRGQRLETSFDGMATFSGDGVASAEPAMVRVTRGEAEVTIRTSSRSTGGVATVRATVPGRGAAQATLYVNCPGPTHDDPSWLSGCGGVTVSPAAVSAGGTVTVGFERRGCGASRLCVTGADRVLATSWGEIGGISGGGTRYGYSGWNPFPNPAGGYCVDVPSSVSETSVTAQFHMAENVAPACTSDSESGGITRVTGPAAWVDGPNWSSLKMIRIRRAGRTCPEQQRMLKEGGEGPGTFCTPPPAEDARLTIEKKVAPPEGTPATFVVELEVRNETEEDADDVIVTDEVVPAYNVLEPAAADFLTTEGSPRAVSWGQRNKGQVVWTLGKVEAGAQKVMRYRLHQAPNAAVRDGTVFSPGVWEQRGGEWIVRPNQENRSAPARSRATLSAGGSNMIVSNMPESFDAVDDAVLYKQQMAAAGGPLVSSGPLRLFVHHASRPKTFFYVLRNRGEAPVTLTRGARGVGTSGDSLDAGDQASDRYMRARAVVGPARPEQKTVPARGAAAVRLGESTGVLSAIEDLILSGPVEVGIVAVGDPARAAAFESDPSSLVINGAATSYDSAPIERTVPGPQARGTFSYSDLEVKLPAYDPSDGRRYAVRLGEPLYSAFDDEYQPRLDGLEYPVCACFHQQVFRDPNVPERFGTEDGLYESPEARAACEEAEMRAMVQCLGPLLQGNFGAVYRVSIDLASAVREAPVQVFLQNRQRFGFVGTVRAGERFVDVDFRENVALREMLAVARIPGDQTHLDVDVVIPGAGGTPLAVILQPAFVRGAAKVEWAGEHDESGTWYVPMVPEGGGPVVRPREGPPVSPAEPAPSPASPSPPSPPKPADSGCATTRGQPDVWVLVSLVAGAALLLSRRRAPAQRR